METVAAGNIDSVADLLSVHFYEGGDLERAWRYARLAGSNAHASYANVDAAALYRRALEAARRLGEVKPDQVRATWTALGDVLEQAGLPEGAMDAYRRATALAGDDQLERARSFSSVRGLGSVLAGSSLHSWSSAQRSGLWPDDPSEGAERVRVASMTMRAIIRQGQEQPRRALHAAQRAAADAEQVDELESWRRH